MATAEAEVLAAVAATRGPTGESTAIRQVVSLIEQVAIHESSVLVLGESGTARKWWPGPSITPARVATGPSSP